MSVWAPRYVGFAARSPFCWRPRAGQSWSPGRSTLPPARKPIPSSVSDSVCLRAAMPRRLGSQPLRLCGLRAPQLGTPPSVLRAGNARSPRLLPIRSRILLLAAEAGRLAAQRPPSALMGDEDVHVGHSTGSRARIHGLGLLVLHDLKLALEWPCMA